MMRIGGLRKLGERRGGPQMLSAESSSRETRPLESKKSLIERLDSAVPRAQNRAGAPASRSWTSAILKSE